MDRHDLGFGVGLAFLLDVVSDQHRLRLDDPARILEDGCRAFVAAPTRAKAFMICQLLQIVLPVLRCCAGAQQNSEKLAGSELALDTCCLQHVADVCFYFKCLTPKAPAKESTSTCGEEKLRGLVELPCTQHNRATTTVEIRGRGRAQQGKMHVADLELPGTMSRSVFELARIIYRLEAK